MLRTFGFALAALFFALLLMGARSSGTDQAVPVAAVNSAKAAQPSKQTVVVAGGCFWGIQAVFQHVKGVTKATSGYAGGNANTAEYELVSMGDTGHAESVQVTYDPSQVTLGELLRVFFSVALDPTQVNSQGPDEGTQYRSVIFYGSDEQKKIADAYIAQLDAAKVFPRKIATQVTPLKGFYPAEAYHQDYFVNHPTSPYIMFNDAPKVANLKKEFPELYTGK
ncbi:MAG TPA: peptide-methionine (S)-S-oxide reductase MsrA [Terriglobales bacterium]|nr:peptide-methionine (S)-S-oxide reductase MsrA [Terriglobales bacterium]